MMIRRVKSLANKLSSRRISKIGIALGTLSLPIATWSMYERINALPQPLGQMHYPVIARIYLRLALRSGLTLEQKAHYLERAMRSLLNKGYGAISPQYTNLIIFLSQLYMDQDPPSVNNLMASFQSLTHKPHVGEGVAEERARLEMAFKVAGRLVDILPEDASRREIAQKVLIIMKKSPPYLGTWKNVPDRSKFESLECH